MTTHRAVTLRGGDPADVSRILHTTVPDGRTLVALCGIAAADAPRDALSGLDPLVSCPACRADLPLTEVDTDALPTDDDPPPGRATAPAAAPAIPDSTRTRLIVAIGDRFSWTSDFAREVVDVVLDGYTDVCLPSDAIAQVSAPRGGVSWKRTYQPGAFADAIRNLPDGRRIGIRNDFLDAETADVLLNGGTLHTTGTIVDQAPCSGFVPKPGFGNSRTCKTCGGAYAAHPVRRQ